MGKGKIGAQCAHAVLKTLANRPSQIIWKDKNIQVFKVTSEQQLLDAKKIATEQDLCFGFVRDAGRTQVVAGTCTVIGVLIPLMTDHKITQGL